MSVPMIALNSIQAREALGGMPKAQFDDLFGHLGRMIGNSKYFLADELEAEIRNIPVKKDN